LICVRASQKRADVADGYLTGTLAKIRVTSNHTEGFDGYNYRSFLSKRLGLHRKILWADCPGGWMQTSDQTPDELKLELERLRAENESLKKQTQRGVFLRVSEKGGISLYGLGRFPITLYVEQWQKIIEMVPEIERFIDANAASLKRKEQRAD
jgi:hypothetical protein